MNKKILSSMLTLGMLALPALLFAASTAHGEGHHEVNYFREVLFPLINFVGLLFLLFIFLKRPMQDFFLTRSKQIAVSLDQAAHEKQEALSRYQQYEARFQNVEKEIGEMKQSFQLEGELAQKKLIEEAKANAKAIQEMATRLSEQELLRVKEALKEEAAKLVVEDAQSLIQKQFNEADQSRLFDKNLSRLEGLQ